MLRNLRTPPDPGTPALNFLHPPGLKAGTPGPVLKGKEIREVETHLNIFVVPGATGVPSPGPELLAPLNVGTVTPPTGRGRPRLHKYFLFLFPPESENIAI